MACCGVDKFKHKTQQPHSCCTNIFYPAAAAAAATPFSERTIAQGTATLQLHLLGVKRSQTQRRTRAALTFHRKILPLFFRNALCYLRDRGRVVVKNKTKPHWLKKPVSIAQTSHSRTKHWQHGLLPILFTTTHSRCALRSLSLSQTHTHAHTQHCITSTNLPLFLSFALI